MCACMWRGPERPSVDRTSPCMCVCMYVCVYVCMRPPYPVDAANPAQTQPTKLPGTVFGRFRGNLPGSLASPAQIQATKLPGTLFGGFGGTCRAARPALPSVAATLPSSVATPAQLCMYAVTPAQLHTQPPLPSYVCMYAATLPSYAATLPSCAATPAQSCSHPCPVTYMEAPKEAHVCMHVRTQPN